MSKNAIPCGIGTGLTCWGKAGTISYLFIASGVTFPLFERGQGVCYISAIQLA